ncbi:hypothetical protein CEXT_404181 [Caerostris extrusa]|uniref:Uncharacterized protein n=1 Tax=Caerostris extrusa TaxID=172846 RepID=A0AAV4MHR8_CAEEX|nr:hypothetical protein CEXT_404181 [Caerostris extrusa]
MAFLSLIVSEGIHIQRKQLKNCFHYSIPAGHERAKTNQSHFHCDRNHFWTRSFLSLQTLKERERYRGGPSMAIAGALLETTSRYRCSTREVCPVNDDNDFSKVPSPPELGIFLFLFLFPFCEPPHPLPRRKA